MEGAARRLVVAILESVTILVTALVEALVRALRSRPFEVAVNLILINGVAMLLRAMTGGPVPTAIAVALVAYDIVVIGVNRATTMPAAPSTTVPTRL